MTDTPAPAATDVLAATLDGDAELEVLLAEYKALKDEQRSRIDRREHLVYLTLTAIAAALATASRLPEALLLLPLVTVILGWTHLVCDQKISAAGQYLREHLSLRLSALVGAAVLGWESAHRGDPRRRQRKRLQLAADLATFPGPAMVALGVYLALTDPPVPGVAVAVLLAAAAVVLAGQQALYATGTRRRSGGRR